MLTIVVGFKSNCSSGPAEGDRAQLEGERGLQPCWARTRSGHSAFTGEGNESLEEVTLFLSFILICFVLFCNSFRPSQACSHIFFSTFPGQLFTTLPFPLVKYTGGPTSATMFSRLVSLLANSIAYLQLKGWTMVRVPEKHRRT